MIKFNDISKFLRTNVKSHSSTILSVTAGVGVLSTAYLSGKAGVQQGKLEDADMNDVDTTKDKIKKYWTLYIPSGMTAASTIVCIVAANRIDSRKMFAAQSAIAVTQRVYSDYRDQVVQEIGEKKEQAIKDKVAQKQIDQKQPTNQDKLLLIGGGNVLCCELFTGRYFGSDMDILKRAQNEINAKMLKHDYATFDDLYYILGISQTTESGHLGWSSDKLLELEFTTCLTDKGEPALAFAYNYHKVL